MCRFRWLLRLTEELRTRALPRSLLGKAAASLLGHWEPLVAHLNHGQSRLDNSPVENAIRPSAIGKKIWLFISHPDAGDRSAIIYSIIASCQRFGIDPFAHLKDVLTRLPQMTNQDDLARAHPGPLETSRLTHLGHANGDNRSLQVVTTGNPKSSPSKDDRGGRPPDAYSVSSTGVFRLVGRETFIPHANDRKGASFCVTMEVAEKIGRNRQQKP